MKKIFVFIVAILILSCDRELDLTTDYNYNATASFVNNVSQTFVNQKLYIKLNLINIGLSKNKFKVKFIANGAINGDGYFYFNNQNITQNSETIFLPGEYIIDYSSLSVGSKNIIIQIEDLGGVIKTLNLNASFSNTNYAFVLDNTDTNINSGKTTFVNYNLKIDNPSYVGDVYYLKYEISNLQYLQDPVNTDSVLKGIVDSNNANIVFNENVYSNITSSILSSPGEIFNFKLKGAAYSQYDIKFTLKNSAGVEKIIVSSHQALTDQNIVILPLNNGWDFVNKYRWNATFNIVDQQIVGGEQTYLLCFNPYNTFNGANFVSYKIFSAPINTNNYTLKMQGTSFQGNTSQEVIFNTPSYSPGYKILTLLYYSDGNVYWVQESLPQIINNISQLNCN